MNKELRKVIYSRSRLRNRLCKTSSKKKEALYKKKQRNKFTSLRRRSIKKYLNDITEHGITTNKNFWNLINIFLTNKVNFNQQDIMIFGDKGIATVETCSQFKFFTALI